MPYAVKDQAGAWTEITGPFVSYGVGPENFERVELDDGTIMDGESLGQDDLSFPYGWADLATPEEREAYGVRAIIETTGYPTDVEVLGTRLVDASGWPKREWVTRTFTVDGLRAQRLEALDAAYAAKLAGGYRFTRNGATEALQVRDQDKANWLTLKDSCNEAIAAGQGGALCPLPMRTMSNENLRLTFSEIADVLRGMRTWVSECMALRWARKDALEAATTRAQIMAVETDTGWPT